MRIPFIPIIIAGTILGGVIYLFNATGNDRRILDVPRLTRLADIDGIETDVEFSPDGTRCAVIADGNLWILNLSDGTRYQLTNTPEAESSPAWSPDGRRITFTQGADTFVLFADGSATTREPFISDATDLSWSATGRLTFVRNRALWLTDVGGRNEKQVVAPDDNPNISIHSARFSPNSLEIAFIKSLLNLNGQIWMVDVLDGSTRQLVADRPAENPLDLGWIMEGQQLVYLTNRSGAYSIWHVDFKANTNLPLTQPLMTIPLASVGIGISQDRIVLPRHFADSNIALSNGAFLVQTDDMELEPAVSRDGKLIAYTTLKANRSEIWTAAIDGANPTFRTIGHQPRFTADGYHLLYTQADLAGNEDIWQVDLRDGVTDRVTDAYEIDVTADASPDGRWIAFSSTRSSAPSIWIIPASGGKRLRINDGGYAPRFSIDSRSIAYWNKGELWLMDIDGSGQRSASMATLSAPAPAAWSPSTLLQVVGNGIQGPDGKVVYTSDRPLWPWFDVLPDGRLLLAPINVIETGLWAIDLQYRTQ